MAVNITTNNNTVKVVTTPANKVKVVNNITNTSVTVSQPTPTQVVKVVTAGPQGQQGPAGAAGAIPNTGSFATTGSNTFIGSQTVSGSVNISGSLNTNNTLYVTGSRVGIGTSTPTAILDVNGTSYLRGVALDGIFGYSGNNIAFSNSGNTTFIGNLGIGTSTPTYTLDVSGSGGTTARFRGTAGQATVSLNDGTTDNYIVAVSGRFQLRPSGNTTLTALSTGEIGIGITAPSSRLQVRGSGATTSTTALRVENTNASASLVVNDAGNVLVGTATDAGFRLDVNGNSRVKGAGATGSTNAFIVQNSAGSNALIITNGLTTNVQGDLQLENSVFYWNAGSQIRNISNGVLRITNSSNSDFTRLQFGGGTTAFPSLQRSGASLCVVDSTGTFLSNLLVGTTTDVASSKLTIESTTQGFLPPRMTNAQRTSISSPAVGLMVYCTDATEGLYVYKSTGWTFIA